MSVNKLQNTDSLSQWATKINDLVDDVADVKSSGGLFVTGATYSPGDLITYDDFDNRWETKELIGLITFDPSYGATGPQIKYNINPSALTEIVGPDSGDLLLAYDASGATMVTLPANSVTTPPGGTEFEIQYNNGSNGFAGATGFVYDPTNSRVGINKTPAYDLDVDGDINATSTIRLGGDEIITSSKDIDNVVNINASGNLELGTVSGGCKLEAEGAICSDYNNGAIKAIFHADGAGKVFIGSQTNHPIGIIQGSTECVKLESGNFTIGSVGTTNLIVNYTSTLKDIKENITFGATAFTGATAFYEVKDNNVLYYTGTNDGNWDLNIRGNSGTTLNTYMAVGESISIAVMATNGATPYYNNRILIDDVAQTVKWLNGVAPTSGNASSIDVYTYTIIKTAASTYTVLGTRAKFA